MTVDEAASSLDFGHRGLDGQQIDGPHPLLEAARVLSQNNYALV